MNNLLSVIDDKDYVSVYDVVCAIHKHIGLDKDIAVAENIFLSILNKEKWKIIKLPLQIYNKKDGLLFEVQVIQEIDGGEKLRLIETGYSGCTYHYFSDVYQATAFIISRNQEERDNELPF